MKKVFIELKSALLITLCGSLLIVSCTKEELDTLFGGGGKKDNNPKDSVSNPKDSSVIDDSTHTHYPPIDSVDNNSGNDQDSTGNNSNPNDSTNNPYNPKDSL